MRRERAQAVYFRIVIEDRKPVLKIGPGDHASIEWELTWDMARGAVLDLLPELLKR